MSDYSELIQVLKYLLNEKFYPKPTYIKALLGDGLGNVTVPGRPDFNYVRFNRSASEKFEVFNKEVSQPVDGTPILVGEYPWQPGLMQVVGIDWAAYSQTGWGDRYAQIQSHAPTHEWPDFSPGSDYMRVFLRSVFPLQGYGGGTGSMSFTAYPYQYDYTGTNSYWPGAPAVDLGPTQPPTGTMRYMGVYLNPATNALGVVTGSSVSYDQDTEPPYPAWPLNVYPVAYARVYGGQAYFIERDIKDARRLWNTTLMFTGTSGGGGGASAATQAEVDAGTVADEYVSPLTFQTGLTTRFGHVLRPDPIINGGLLVWQRPTSFAAAVTSTYTADRWVYYKVGAMVHTISQSSDVPTVAEAGILAPFSLLLDCTTVDAAIAAGDFAVKAHIIEGYNFLPLAQRAFTLSFWVKGTKTGIHCVSFKNSGQDRSYVAEYTINTTATWEYKTITVPASPSAGTWNYGTGIGLNISWVLAAGSTFHTTAGAWQTGNFFATANQVNATDNTANDFRLALVKIEPGSLATPFIMPGYGIELGRCLRYTWIPDATSNTANVFIGAKFSTTLVIANRPWPVPMRITPTLTHNVTAYVNTNPVTTQVALLDFGSGGFAGITGALTLALGSANTEVAALSLTAGTSWTGTAGHQFALRLGVDCRLIFSAEF